MKKILVIQTAFTGDVVLATAVVETLANAYPGLRQDFLVRKGNEGLLKGHPLIDRVIVWDKKVGKYAGLWQILQNCRAERYDAVINLQRFAATGFLTAFSGAKHRLGYAGSAFSRFYSRSVKHIIGQPGVHEVDRNFNLILPLLPKGSPSKHPRLYPAQSDLERINELNTQRCITVSPASVWFTKQWPAYKWSALIDRFSPQTTIFLLGGPSDHDHCEEVRRMCKKNAPINLAGRLSLLQSAELMSRSGMNYTNDSAPLHMAGAVGAPVSAVFCSTVPAFGFGPFLTSGKVLETAEKLDCRPCGLHGQKSCPKGHFRCAESINPENIDITFRPIEKQHFPNDF